MDKVCLILLTSLSLITVLHGVRQDEKLEQRLPQAIIVGVKKSGTRALLEFLRVHPDVRAPGPEVHFFDRHYNLGVDWYREKMPLTSASQITVEKTPSYFVTKQAPVRIKEAYQQNGTKALQLKLIFIVRNPIDRAVSDFVQTNWKYPEVADRSFEDMAVIKLQNGTVRINSSWTSLAIGVYHVFMQRWLQRFAIDSMLVLSCEELVRKPAAAIGKVQSFLGLRDIITQDFFAIDPQKQLPCLTKRVVPNADGSYTVLARRKPHCLGRNKGRPHPAINDTIMKMLQDFYRPLNERFFLQVGKRFDWF